MGKKHILLIVTGSIAACKTPELIRLLQKADFRITTILTKAGAQFITPLTLASLTGTPSYSDLFSLKDEMEMGHIRLSREADMVLVAPASADILAKMAGGFADDLASTVLLASDKPIFAAPAMNVQMWANKAVSRNVAQLKADGVHIIGPEKGELACGEVGEGRMAEPAAICDVIKSFFHHV